ncbi:MAG: DUF2029 domain-containing protein [Planctomycetes bacterium]|nr:DUF2029 domain-containing protein [Planctomycetota bacterium]
MRTSRLWWLPLLLAVMVFGSWWSRDRAGSNDRELPVYVTGGERMAAGEEIYRRGADAKPFTYPPFAALPFVPFARLPADWQVPAWFCLNFTIVLLVVRWLHAFGRRDVPGAPPPRLVWFWGLTLLLGLHHVLSVFANQSHDLLILGTVVLAAAAWCRGRSTAALWAAVGAATKATPLLFVGLFALRLRLLAVTLLLAATAGLTWLPDWWFPRGDGRSWVAVWYDVNLAGLQVGGTASADGAWNAHSWLNQSLSGTLTRLLTAPRIPGAFVDEQVALVHWSDAACKVATLVAQGLVLAVIALGVLFAARAVRAATDRAAMQRTVGLGEVAAIACGMVLLSPQSSKSHFCVWLLPAAFLADRLLRGRRDGWLWLLLGLALLLGPLTGKDLVGKRFANALNAWGNVTWCTVALLAATVRGLWTSGQPPTGITRSSTTTSAA